MVKIIIFISGIAIGILITLLSILKNLDGDVYTENINDDKFKVSASFSSTVNGKHTFVVLRRLTEREWNERKQEKDS